MNQQSKLRAMIDRMVADSIRRILPTVMNEVLLRTIADSGVLSEGRRPTQQARKKPGPKPKLKRRVVEQRATRPQKTAPPRKRQTDLSDLLDESAGAEFYDDPRDRQAQVLQEEYEVELDQHEEEDREADAIPPRELLNPALRALAEDIEIPDDEDGGMWRPGEYDSTGAAVPDLPVVKDVNRAASALGIDFSRMASTIKAAVPANRPDAQDAKNKAIFENRRLEAMRLRLNGGKPIE